MIETPAYRVYQAQDIVGCGIVRTFLVLSELCLPGNSCLQDEGLPVLRSIKYITR